MPVSVRATAYTFRAAINARLLGDLLNHLFQLGRRCAARIEDFRGCLFRLGAEWRKNRRALVAFFAVLLDFHLDQQAKRLAHQLWKAWNGCLNALAGVLVPLLDSDLLRRANLAALQESKRRIAAFDKEQKHADEQLEAARADAAGAGSALERLQLRLAAAEQRSRAAGNTITAQLSQAAEADSRVRTELLGRLGALAKLYAGAADESRIAGQTCERSFDSLGGG